MKIMRYRKPSLNTLLGITQAKRNIARATGIPTTKYGRKRKMLNTLTNGGYSKMQRTRANITRPMRVIKRPPTPMGCMFYVIGMVMVLALMIAMM